MPTKILIHTDSVTLPSGLAETTRNIFYPLLDKYPREYIINQLGWFHFGAHGVSRPRWPITPTKLKDGKPDDADKYGRLTFPKVVKEFNPDIVFAYGDIWCWDHILTSALRNRFKLIVYYTVDGQPYFGHLEADGSTAWGKLLSRADKVISLSKWGMDILKGGCPELEGVDCSYVYPPFDPELIKPLPEEKREPARMALLGPKYHGQPVIGFVGRNQFRKQNHKLWETHHYLVHGDYIICEDCGRITVKDWDHTRRRPREKGEILKYDPNYDYSECWYCGSSNIKPGQPRDVLLALHMPRKDPSWNPDLFARMWDIESQVTFTVPRESDQSLRKEQMPDLYACFDIFYYPSGGEGWGNPCGLPGTTIQTKAGRKKIEDVQLGELVLTDKNRYRPVTKLYKREYTGQIIEIQPFYSEPVKVTANHPVLTSEGWKKAADLAVGDFLISPRILYARSVQGSTGNPGWVEDDTDVLLQIQDIRRSEGTSTVYNFDVEEDHTYCMGDFVTHNCSEAMLCEVPIVFTRYSSHAEFAQHGGIGCNLESLQPELYHGIYRAVIDTGDAVKQLLYLLDNEDKRKELGAAGREYMSQFSNQNMVETWHKIFQELKSKNTNNRLYLASV